VENIMTQKILVLGGTGMFGKPTAYQLKADGFQVRLLVRDPDTAQKIFGDGFEITQGDVTNLASLEKAMIGCYGVHISVGGPVDQLSAENVAALARKLGVDQVTYISGATVSEKNRWFPMVAQKLEAEKAIQNCGVPYTIFCPTWPMEQIVRFARDGKPSLIGKQPLLVHFFAAQDLARMISKSYQSDDAKNKRFYVYGPEAITMKTALERYCAKFHPEVEKISVMPIWMAKLMGTLTGNEMLKFASGLMAYFDKTSEVGDPTEANEILGAPATTLDAWMESLKSKGA
jgi:NADH dehydrogenase